MRYRCINAFWVGEKVYPGGVEVVEGDPILETHRAHFTATESAPPAAVRIEQATAAPQELRTVSTTSRPPVKKAPPKKATTKEPEEGNNDA